MSPLSRSWEPATSVARSPRTWPCAATRFRIYQEGTGPALARVMDAIDRERIAIADRLGVPTTPFVESLHQSGYTTAEGARTGQAYPALQAGDAIRNVTAPPTLDHRY